MVIPAAKGAKERASLSAKMLLVTVVIATDPEKSGNAMMPILLPLKVAPDTVMLPMEPMATRLPVKVLLSTRMLPVLKMP